MTLTRGLVALYNPTVTPLWTSLCSSSKIPIATITNEAVYITVKTRATEQPLVNRRQAAVPPGEPPATPVVSDMLDRWLARAAPMRFRRGHCYLNPGATDAFIETYRTSSLPGSISSAKEKSGVVYKQAN